MTYRELSQELGVNGEYMSRLADLGIVKKSAVSMLGSYDGDELKSIRKCCLFSMLGISPETYYRMLHGEADFKETIKKQVDAIIQDENNRSQAAIVLQNMKRECASEAELDPEPYLQHIKELKFQGGIFYDINSLKPTSGESKQTSQSGNGRRKGILAGFFSYNDGQEDREDRTGKENRGYNGEKESDNRDTEKHYYRSPDDDKKANEKDSGQENVSTRYYYNFRKPWEAKEDAADTQGNKVSDINITGNDVGESKYDESNASGANVAGTNKTSNDGVGQNRDGVNASGVNGASGAGGTAGVGAAGYEEKWSPYGDKGLGASNLGSGNWHGWSAGHGSYTGQVGTRERINNGEKTCPHPIKRYVARVLDTTLVNILGCTVLKLGFRINTGLTFQMNVYCEIIFWVFSLMIEPLLLTTIGTTPGKWIMGIKVRDMKTGGNLDLKKAYIRSFRLAWHGFGFMIPIYTIFKRITSFVRCKFDDTLPWDEGINVEITDKRAFRLVICIIVIVVMNFSDEIISEQALIPGNRGEMTREQFYENVAEVMKYTGYNGDMPNFEVKTSGNYVKSVTLTYTDKQYDIYRYNEMYIGFLAFAGAAEGSNGFLLQFASPAAKMNYYYLSFQTSYCGVNIVNESDSGLKDTDSYSLLLALLYGDDKSMEAYNQTFTMSK